MTSPPPAWTPAPPAAPRPRVRRRFLIIGAVWLVILLASAWFGFANPTATDREQTTVASARPIVNEAIALVASVVAAEADAVVAVSGFEHVESCDVTVFRGGGRYRRALVAVVPPGTEVGLLTRVADRLPAAYQAVVRGGDDPRLSADVGYWVLLTGSVPGPGEVRFVADTGDCRAVGDLQTTDVTPELPPDVLPDLLSRLGLGDGAWALGSVSCVDGGLLGTVEVRLAPYAGDLRTALDEMAGATVVVEEASLFAYRTSAIEVAVRVHEDATIVTATTGCRV